MNHIGQAPPSITPFGREQMRDIPAVRVIPMGYFGKNPDIAGYAEAPQDMGYFAEAPVEGYVREQDTSPHVVPLENIGDVKGYYRPQTINPTVETFRPPEAETSKPTSTWFQPLW
jgi:hypothetical protein